MMTPGRVISWTQYGYRMIGSPRGGVARNLGQFAAGPVLAPPASSYGGELAPAAPTRPSARVVALHTSPVAPVTRVTPQPPPVPPSPPVVHARVAMPTIAQASCPPCEYSTGSVVRAAVGGAAAGGLLMWLVGLATKEKRKR